MKQFWVETGEIKMSGKRNKFGWIKRAVSIILILIVLLAGWILFDLYRPHRVEMRRFDADEVARLDTAMWRSYYAKQPFVLFTQLGELMRTQYKLPFFRSNLLAYYAARAAFVFKDGKNRADYEKALPDLIKFYSEIRSISDIPFDVEKVSKLELEWWIVHRERQNHAPEDLEIALAEAAAAIYQIPPGNLREYGRFRAQAMKIRDTKAEQGGVTEDDWQQIDTLLHQSWQSLHKVVNP
jgi:hypothetical protein